MAGSAVDTYVERLHRCSKLAAERILAGMAAVRAQYGDHPLGYEEPSTLEACVAFLMIAQDPRENNLLVEREMARHPGWDRSAGDDWLIGHHTTMLNAIDARGGPEAVRFAWRLQNQTQDMKAVEAALDHVYSKQKVEIVPPLPRGDIDLLGVSAALAKIVQGT